MSTYEIFKTGIHPKGFYVIGYGDFIDDHCFVATCKILGNLERTAEMTGSDFSNGKRCYSFDVLEYLLIPFLNDCLGK